MACRRPQRGPEGGARKAEQRYTFFLEKALSHNGEKQHTHSALGWPFSPDNGGETRQLKGPVLNKSQACNNILFPHYPHPLWDCGWGGCVGNSWLSFPCLLQTQKDTWEDRIQSAAEEGTRSAHPVTPSPSYLLSSPNTLSLPE